MAFPTAEAGEKCPPSPALLLCPTEVVDDTEDIKDGTLLTKDLCEDLAQLLIASQIHSLGGF